MNKILIVDDDEYLRKYIAILLQQNGYETYVANDGLSGLEKANNILPELIIMDCVMPQMSGIEAIQKLSESSKTKDIKILLMSTEDININKVEFLQKPFNPDYFLNKVNQLLNN